MGMTGPFPSYLRALEARYGPEAGAVRHELFFAERQAFPRLRGWAALLRDAAWLTRRGSAWRSSGEALAVLVTTLPGASGWKTLERALPAIARAGLTPVVLAHPRLPASLFPSDLPLLRPAGARLRAMLPDRGPGRVGAALARRALWRQAVANVLAGERGVLLLHNDFDMMSASSLGLGWPTICLQHGIPTDEFFPCRADFQVVWGASSAASYAEAGTDRACLVVDALGRGDRAPGLPSAPPRSLALVSQTQAAIFGPELPARLTSFAAALAARGLPLTALLHPGEASRSPYGRLPFSQPPHAWLSAERPVLVMAFCSTMAIDCALAGHWVLNLDLGIPGNGPAHAVADPPLHASSPEEAGLLFQRLVDDKEFRMLAAQRQQAWLKATFAHSPGGLETILRRAVLP